MDDAELRQIADALDVAADEPAPKPQISQTNSLLWVTVNRTACLRFGAAFIRAATEPIIEGDCRAKPISIDHEQVCESETDSTIGAIQRIDKLPDSPDSRAWQKPGARRNDRVALLGCAVVGFVVMFLTVSGIAMWWGIFTGKQ